MTVEVDVERRLGGFHLRARFVGEAGITALFGRSGAGKTSLIRLISGLLRPDRGRIAVDGRVLFDSGERIDLRPRLRRVGYVFQEGLLFPHLTVRQNLLYGRWFTPARERTVDFDQVVALLGIAHLLRRRPASLSGGEKQRVAIGRALLASPRMLLMDEPLASLDLHRKGEILPYIERLRDEMRLPIVYVSHSIDEVVRLATTLVLLSDGQVAAAGPVDEVMSRLDLFPLTGRYEAGAVIEARVVGHDDGFALSTLRFDGGELIVPRVEATIGAAVRVRVRARDVAIATRPPADLSILNVLRGTIAEISAEGGTFAELRLVVGDTAIVARITRRSVHDLCLAPGREAYALVKSIALDRHSLGLMSGSAAESPPARPDQP